LTVNKVATSCRLGGFFSSNGWGGFKKKKTCKKSGGETW